MPKKKAQESIVLKGIEFVPLGRDWWRAFHIPGQSLFLAEIARSKTAPYDFFIDANVHFTASQGEVLVEFVRFLENRERIELSHPQP